MDINKVFLIGRLTQKPELRNVGDKFVTDLSLASNYDKEKVSYFDVTVWGKQAENCCEYLDKGDRIAIDGRLNQDKWKDENGNNRYKVKIIANRVQFLNNKSDKQSSSINDSNVSDDDDPAPF